MPLEDIKKDRVAKLRKLSEAGLDPYPADAGRIKPIGEVLSKFLSLERAKKKVCLAGRIMALREHGGSAFSDIKDGSGIIQVYFKEDILGEQYRLFLGATDIGDFIYCEGRLFKTKKGEMTLEVSSWAMLSKSLLPLPEKWHGLQDVEERFRKRYLDLLMNDDIKKRFLERSRIIKSIRDFFAKESFDEVQTPVLHPVPGGALARPFKTHHNALGIDLYLRVAPELYLKRLLVGGFDKVYELGMNFRNEGIDAVHNPEFTELECYAAYWNEDDMMRFTEKFFVAILKNLKRKPEILFEEKVIRIKPPFPRVDFKDILKRYALITDYDSETRDSMALRAKQFGVEVGNHESKGKIADEIYKKICRPYLVNPTFVIHHPLEISPLAKKVSQNSDEVRRFQLIVGGLEIANGFAELNDPEDQRARFEAQQKEREGGEEEAHPIDNDFIEALEYGMPPAAGLGIGIDRLVMILTNVKNIREVILFPTMRPK